MLDVILALVEIVLILLDIVGNLAAWLWRRAHGGAVTGEIPRLPIPPVVAKH